jgi:hypothetical protein
MTPFLGLSRNSIMGAVPEIGSEVIVRFPTKDKYHPEYNMSYLTNTNKNNFLDEDYPNSYGFKDSIGNYFKVNKVKKQMRIQHSSGTNIDIIENGDMFFRHADTKDEHDNTVPGAYIKIDKDGKIYHSCKIYQVDASESVIMNTKDMTVNASNSVRVNTKDTTINSKLHVTKDTDITANLFVLENTDIGGNLGVQGSGAIGGSLVVGGVSTASDHISGGKSGKSHIHAVLSEHYGSTSAPQ